MDAPVRRLAAITPAKYHGGVNLLEIGDHGLGAFFHRHEIDAKGTPVERGIYYQLDGEARIDRTVHGTSEEVFGPRNDDAPSSFLVDTPFRLHVPTTWAFLYLALLALAIWDPTFAGCWLTRPRLE